MFIALLFLVPKYKQLKGAPAVKELNQMWRIHIVGYFRDNIDETGIPVTA